MKISTRIFAVCAAALPLAACGSSGDATLTKQQYATELSRLCLVVARPLGATGCYSG